MRELAGIIDQQDGLIGGQGIHVRDTQVQQAVIIHIARHILSHGLRQFGKELAAAPFAALDIYNPLVTAQIVQVDQRLCLSASAAAADTYPFALSPGNLERPLHLPVRGYGINHIAGILIEIKACGDPDRQVVVIRTVLAGAELGHGRVGHTAATGQF